MSKIHPSLKAMAEDKEQDQVSKITNFRLHPDVVQFMPGFNLREPGPELDAHIEKLYQAMKAGARVPAVDVDVVDGIVWAWDGHCRTTAAKRIWAEGGEYFLDARQMRGGEEAALFHMLGSDQGKKYSPLEQGKGFLRAVNMGRTVAEIAALLGIHRSTVENGLALVEAPREVQQMIGEGKVNAHTALKVVRDAKKSGDVAKATETLKAASEKTGGKKVTAKHLNGPKERGQTLPPIFAPWPDAVGNEIRVGEILAHPDGSTFTVDYDASKEKDGAQWRAVYPDGESLWLGNQIGGKGQAVVKSKRTALQMQADDTLAQYRALHNLAIKLAALSPQATPKRDVVAALITEARGIVGSPE